MPVEPSFFSLSHLREFCKQEMSCLREDHRRFLNPTPYKVSVSQTLFEFIHRLWLEETPIPELV
jgi:nicotinate phosphoribosyltransferase